MDKSNIFSLKKELTDMTNVIIKTSRDASNYARGFYFDDLEIYESFFIILLNTANKTLGYAKISQGGINGTYVDKRIIANFAINSLCRSIILVHNHPSGTLSSSKEDIKLTKDIVKCLSLFDVNVLDHIIITKDSYYSMKENGDY